MIVHRVRHLVLLSAIAAAAAPAGARQTGPRTLENLLVPPANGGRDEQRTPFDDPPPGAAKPTAAAEPPKPVKRLPVPEQAAVNEAIELINQAYDEQIKAAASDAETAIRTFRDTADKTTDPARKFALLLLAERLALDAKAMAAALDVVARRAAIFGVDPLAARHALLMKIARDDDFRPDAALFEAIITTANRAVAADQFDLADAAADLAHGTAKAMEKDEKARAVESRRKKEPPPKPVAGGLIAEANLLQKMVRERRRLAFDYTAARDTLKDAPDDDAAAEVVGRYLCCVKGDWKSGLVALAKGGHEGLRGLAGRELALAKEPDAKPVDRLKLANDWWKLSEDGDGLLPAETEAVRLHAGVMYGAMAAKLTDPVYAALARKRAKEMGVAERAPEEGPVTGDEAARPVAGAAESPLGTAPPTLDSLFPGGG